MKRFFKITGIAIFGFILIVISFVHGAITGVLLPYPDMPPEEVAYYGFHSGVSSIFMGVGAFVLLIGFIAMPIIYLKTRKVK
jgi:hypothetical protein